jgi:AcrR family transcriptional regulator
VVDERGFHELTVEAVARRAGVTRPVVYEHFGDLEGLLLALAEREEAAALATLAAVVPDDPAGREPDALLVDAIEAFLVAVRRAPRTWRLVLRPPDGTPPALRERIGASRRRLAAQVAALLAWGLERRGGPRGLDHEVLARLLIAVAEDAARLELAHPRRFPPDRLAAAARGLLALLPPEAA